MPSFSDSIVLFILALLLFGPKRLPQLARELGKWVGEFRRASNEFKMQMEEELRLSDQAERNKKIAAIEAAAPTAPALVAPTIHPDAKPAASGELDCEEPEEHIPPQHTATQPAPEPIFEPTFEIVDGVRKPIPIATSGDLNIMPPATGLPSPRSSTPKNSALAGLIQSIPEAAPENPTHGE
jgi:sec-independent protein translocase protein TatB